MPQSPYAVQPPTKEGWFAKLDQFKGWAMPVIVALLGSGFLLLPAKDRDVKDLAVKVEQIDKRLERTDRRIDALGEKFEATFEKFNAKLDRLQESNQQAREDLIRLSVQTASQPLPPPTVPPDLKAKPSKAAKTSAAPKITPKPKPVQQAAEKSEPTLLQKIFQQ